MARLVPLADRVIVRRDEEATVTPGGIVLPDSAKEKPKLGRVLAVGTGPMLQDGKFGPMLVKEGDRVLF